MTFRLIFITVLFFSALTICKSQEKIAFDYLKIYQNLRLKAAYGDKMAIRDLGSFLDNPVIRDSVLRTFQRILFLTKDELDLRALNRQSFLDFFYQNEEKIKYSEIIGGYYMTPLELQKTDFILQDFNLDSIQQSNLYSAFFSIDSLFISPLATSKIVGDYIDKLVQLDIDQGFELLYSLLINQSWENLPVKEQEDVKRKIIRSIVRSGNEKGFKTLMEALNKGIVTPDEVVYPLVLMTNTQVDAGIPLEDTWSFFNHLKDSIEDFSKIRNIGLEQIFDFKQMYFDDLVDYYGKVLSRKPGGLIRLNTIKDMMLTKDPVCLYYLAALIFDDNTEDAFFEKPGVDLLERWSGDRVVFSEGSISTSKPDTCNNILLKKKFLIYWASNYKFYEWDEYRGRYINKQRTIKEKESYEILFRSLTSENNKVALDAFSRLVRGNPQTLIPITQQFRKQLRNINPVVPDLRNNWFESLSLLNAYMKNSGIWNSYELPVRLLIDSLKSNISAMSRYDIENKIIRTIDLSGINELEFDACIYAENTEFSCSSSRILDYWYGLNADLIFHNEANLLLFLKKAALFSKIGESGICNLYLNKISRQDAVILDICEKIKHKSTDPDILNQTNIILDFEHKNNDQLLDFFENPLYYENHHLLGNLPPPDSTEMELLINAILNTTESEIRDIYLSYWEASVDISSTPYLFYILQSQSDNDLNVKIIKLIEGIYNYYLPENERFDFWINKWTRDQDTYQNWREDFYKQDLLNLTKMDSLGISSLNKVMTSQYFKAADMEICVAALSKVKPYQQVKFISSRIDFDASKHLFLFETIDFKPKELLYLMRFFNKPETNILENFILEKSKEYTIDEKGALFNDLFFVKWFSEEIDDERLSPEFSNEIKNTLITYLNESSFISEFEEQNTLMHILQLENFGKSIEDKLISTFQPELELATRQRIQQSILAKADFQDISLLMPYANDMDFNYWDLLRSDFGLPVYPESDSDYKLLEQQFKQLDINEIRKYYVKKICPQIFLNNDSLNLNAVMQILSYDLCIPFAGDGGINRDVIQFAVIKLLEKEYQTSLGFHPKLNENQIFYTYNSRKRANAWRKYLISKELNVNQIWLTPSFNDLPDRSKLNQ